MAETADRLRGPSGRTLGGPARAEAAEIAGVLASARPIRAVFQPVVALATGHVAGYEALARFPGMPGREPGAVFAQARRCGMAPELEAAAIRAALAAAGRRPRGTWLAINVSPMALTAPQVLEALPDDLSEVIVEITEQELVTDDDCVEARLVELRERGARVAVDDAGAAYAGLQHIVRMQPEIIKLDRSLVAGVRSRPDKAALIDCFVGFAQRTGALVCAEGIESLDDLAVLADLDVAYGQGFALARPAPPWTTIAPAVAAELLRWSVEGRAAELAPLDLAASSDRRLERLVERLSAVTTPAELDGVTELIAQELHADEVLVSRWLPERGQLESLGRGGAPTGQRFALADYPLTRRVVETRVAAQVVAGDPAADPAELTLLEELGFRSGLLVPVLAGGRSVGLLEAYSREERPWTRTEVNRARIVSYQLGAALQTLRTTPTVIAAAIPPVRETAPAGR
jgi:EAL domain-containing protein (putative c-di-GMP-specific phosphodiesterase class I)